MALIDNLAAAYEMDEASGSLLDVHGGFNLTANNAPGTAAGKIGTARTFSSGSSQNFSSTNSIFNPGTSDFSIMAWMYHTASPNAGIIRKGCTSEVSGAVKVGYGLGINSGGPFLQFHDGVNVSNRLTVQVAGAQTQNTWYHLAATYDRDGFARLYLNGSLIGSTDISAYAGNVNPTAAFSVGSYSTSGGGFSVFYTGRIDLVRYYLRNLDGTEISAHYNSGNALAYSAFAINRRRRLLLMGTR